MQENLHRVGIGVTAPALRCHIKKVEIVNDNFGLRKDILLDKLSSPSALRLTENHSLGVQRGIDS